MPDLFIVDSQYSIELANSRARKNDLVYILRPVLFDELRTNGVVLSPLIIYKTLSDLDKQRFDRMLVSALSDASTTEQRIYGEIKSIVSMFILVKEYIRARKIHVCNIFISSLSGAHERLNSGLSHSAYEMIKLYSCSDICHRRMIVAKTGMTMPDQIKRLAIQCIYKINRTRGKLRLYSMLRRDKKSCLEIVLGSGIPGHLVNDKKAISFIPQREMNLERVHNRTVFCFNMRCCRVETDALKDLLKLIIRYPEYLYEHAYVNPLIMNCLSIMASSMLARLKSEARWIMQIGVHRSTNLFLSDHNNILFYLFLDLFASSHIALLRHGGQRYDPRTLRLISQGMSRPLISYKEAHISSEAQESIRYTLDQQQVILIVSYAAFKETGFKYLPDTMLKACDWIEYVKRIMPDRICIAKKYGSEALTTSLDLGLTCDLQIQPTTSSLALGPAHIGFVVAIGIIGSAHHLAMDLGIPLLYLGDEPNQCAGSYVKVNALIDELDIIVVQSNGFNPHPSSKSAIAGYFFAHR